MLHPGMLRPRLEGQEGYDFTKEGLGNNGAVAIHL